MVDQSEGKISVGKYVKRSDVLHCLFDKAILRDHQQLPTCYIKWRPGRVQGTQVIWNSEYNAIGLSTLEVTILNKDGIVKVVGSRSLKLVILTWDFVPTYLAAVIRPAVGTWAREYQACHDTGNSPQSFHSRYPTFNRLVHEDESFLRSVPKESSR